MVFEFAPWRLDVDIEATKQFYEENDYAKDKTANEDFIESLTPEQKEFFDSLGVDLLKIEVDKVVYDISEDDMTPASKINRTAINFLICGKILALPQYQKDLYSDKEIFGEEFPESIEVLFTNEEDYLQTYDNGIGAGVVFKHPCIHYDGKDELQKWDCGYILGAILIFEEESR